MDWQRYSLTPCQTLPCSLIPDLVSGGGQWLLKPKSGIFASKIVLRTAQMKIWLSGWDVTFIWQMVLDTWHLSRYQQASFGPAFEWANMNKQLWSFLCLISKLFETFCWSDLRSFGANHKRAVTSRPQCIVLLWQGGEGWLLDCQPSCLEFAKNLMHNIRLAIPLFLLPF